MAGPPRLRAPAVSIAVEHPQWPFLLPFTLARLEELLMAMASAVECGEVELALATDAAIASKNLRHLGLPGPTNILSFPAGNGGSLALSLDAVHREALFYGQDPGLHILRLLSHGLAHLKGHEHGQRMARCEDRAFAAAANALKREDAL